MADPASETASDKAKSLLDELIDNVKNRLSGGLFSSYLISVALVNYRVAPVLFSVEHYKKSYAYIDSVLYPDFHSCVLKLVVWPLGLALLYTFLIPLIEIRVDVIKEWIADFRRKTLLRVKQEQTISVEERRVYFAKWNSVLADYEKRFAEEYNHAVAERDRSSKVASDLQSKLDSAAKQRAADYGHVSLQMLERIKVSQPWVYIQQHKEEVDRFAWSFSMLLYKRFADYCATIPLDHTLSRRAGLQWVSDTYRIPAENIDDLRGVVTILHGLGVIEVDFTNYEFRFANHPQGPFHNISEVSSISSVDTRG